MPYHGHIFTFFALIRKCTEQHNKSKAQLNLRRDDAIPVFFEKVVALHLEKKTKSFPSNSSNSVVGEMSESEKESLAKPRQENKWDWIYWTLEMQQECKQGKNERQLVYWNVYEAHQKMQFRKSKWY